MVSLNLKGHTNKGITDVICRNVRIVVDGDITDTKDIITNVDVEDAKMADIGHITVSLGKGQGGEVKGVLNVDSCVADVD